MSNQMSASVRWLGNEVINFEATTGSGHQVLMDSAVALGARPMELMLAALGGCASYDVVSILKKSRQAICDVRCEVSGVRVDAVPAVFSHIHLHFVVMGTDIKETQVAKAVELSATKYCSATRMLAAGGVVISHDYVIVAAGE